MSVTKVCMCVSRHNPSLSVFSGLLSPASEPLLFLYSFMQPKLLHLLMCQSHVTCAQVYKNSNRDKQQRQDNVFIDCWNYYSPDSGQ